MPYKSEAQRRLFHAKLASGEIDPGTVKEFDTASKGMPLPERVGLPKKPLQARSVADLKKIRKDKYGI